MRKFAAMLLMVLGFACHPLAQAQAAAPVCAASSPCLAGGTYYMYIGTTYNFVLVTPAAGASAPSTGGGTTTPTLTLSGVPTNASTTASSQAIGWVVTPSTTAVYCHLDAYTPIVCPNPFKLTPLAVGTHKVEFFQGSATGPLLGATSWTIAK